MIAINIVGFRDGSRPFKIEESVSELPSFHGEFVGTVLVEGVLRKHRNGITLDAHAEGVARLICDRSLEEFDEPISASFFVEFVDDASLARQQRGRIADLDDDEVRGIGEDDRVIDITEDVRQVLTIALPMRHVAPAYRDRPLDEIHPAFTGRDVEGGGEEKGLDDRWTDLEKLKRQ